MHYEEMVSNLEILIEEKAIQNKKIYLFGHCNATEELADLLLKKGFFVEGILDNNIAKHGSEYQGILIKEPKTVLLEESEQVIVCIVARAYAAMTEQLRRSGYKGLIRKLVDYNSYAEYSLSEDTFLRMKKRVERGKELLEQLKMKYKTELHCHTKESSSCSQIDAKQLVDVLKGERQ